MQRYLYEMRRGERGVVLQVLGKGALRQRVLDMGITSGTEITVSDMAPFGDPMLLCLRGYTLSIRKEDAKRILLEVRP